MGLAAPTQEVVMFAALDIDLVATLNATRGGDVIVTQDARRKPTALPPARGEVIRQVETAQFRFTLARYAPGETLQAHAHEHPGIVFVVAGHVEEAFASEALTAGAGTLLVKEHDIRHTNRFGAEGAVVFVIEQTEPAPAVDLGSRRPMLREAAFVRMVGFSLAQDLNGERLCDIALTSHAVDLWTVAGARGGDRSVRIARAVERIHDDIGSVQRMEDLARCVDVHPVYLARGFRKRFGCSLASYVRRVRLARAVELARGTGRTLAAVAADTGFADQAHMTRAFRRYYGRTPREIRSRGC